MFAWPHPDSWPGWSLGPRQPEPALQTDWHRLQMIHRQVHFCLFNTGWKLPESSNSKICRLLQILGRRERNKYSSSSVCLSRYQQERWGALKCDKLRIEATFAGRNKGMLAFKKSWNWAGEIAQGKDVRSLSVRNWDCISAPLLKAGHG